MDKDMENKISKRNQDSFEHFQIHLTGKGNFPESKLKLMLAVPDTHRQGYE